MRRKHSPFWLVLVILIVAILACDMSPVQQAADDAIKDAEDGLATAVADALADAGEEVKGAVEDAVGEVIPGFRKTPVVVAGKKCPPLTGIYIQVPSGANQLRLRSSPEIRDDNIIGFLVGGDCYDWANEQDGWYLITTEIGLGWVSSDLVKREYRDVILVLNPAQVMFPLVDSVYRWLDSPPVSALSRVGDADDLLGAAAEIARIGSKPIPGLSALSYGSIGINTTQCISPLNTEGLKPCGKAAVDGLGIVSLSALVAGLGAAATVATAPAWVPFAVGGGILGIGASIVGKFLLR